MPDMTLTELERLRAQAAGEPAEALAMDEELFRAFYDRTAKALWAYLAHVTGDPHTADDLLQESYYRLLRTNFDWESDAHRRHYLFRIATNLVHDSRRRGHRLVSQETMPELSHAPRVEEDTQRRADLSRAMAHLRPRDRAMLWLAYAQGASHREIADSVGVKAASVKLLLFRARRKLAALLTAAATTRENRREN
ncbi:MAG TPA: RNA polymerase sigma factor [Vicinamibacterales bacterium]|jgi:RNA polymerase sigma-70 factor, ECF subfamily|nr:RNA polymerase sigma factor [Vicinamibacterales bacterium]